MRARLICIGERMPAWVQQGYFDYTKRLGRDLPLELIEIALAKRGKSVDLKRAIAAEGQAMQAAIPKHSHVVALDGGGTPWSSEDLARQVARWRMQGQDLAFLVGGPDGLAPELRARAEQCWSLGPLTLPHPLVRIIVAEQLYRAVSMLGNHPYHRA